MRNNGLYNYYEINSYCKSERICTEYLMHEIQTCNKRKSRIKALLVAALVRIAGK